MSIFEMTSTESAFRLIGLMAFLALILLGILEMTERGKRFRNSFFGVTETSNMAVMTGILIVIFSQFVDYLPGKLAIAATVVLVTLAAVVLVEAFLMQKRRDFVWRTLRMKH